MQLSPLVDTLWGCSVLTVLTRSTAVTRFTKLWVRRTHKPKPWSHLLLPARINGNIQTIRCSAIESFSRANRIHSHFAYRAGLGSRPSPRLIRWLQQMQQLRVLQLICPLLRPAPRRVASPGRGGSSGGWLRRGVACRPLHGRTNQSAAGAGYVKSAES